MEYCNKYKLAQTKYIHSNSRVGQNPKIKQLQDAKTFIQNYILSPFDFIAITERQDESLVVLKLLLNLEDQDIIVLSAKQAGSWEPGGMGDCALIQKGRATPEMTTWLHTNFTLGNYDFLLYAAANQSLDRTIDALGRVLVQQEVKRHRMLKRVAEEKCQSKAHFPCSANGTMQMKLSRKSCFAEDLGCGHECVQNALRDFDATKDSIQVV